LAIVDEVLIGAQIKIYEKMGNTPPRYTNAGMQVLNHKLVLSLV